MEIKIIRFVLMIVFVMFAVSCSVDAGGMPCFVNYPLLPIEVFPDEIPELEEPEFHIYTDEEREQIRQNLIGRYQSVLNNRTSILEIRADGFALEIGEEINEQYLYSIAFPVGQHPFFVISEGGIEHEMVIRFRLNTFEVIGLFGLEVEDDIDIFEDMLGYYYRLPDHQEPVHDEI